MKPYPRTKPSGVEWLGDVPEHWEVKRLKTEATCWVSNVDKVPSEDELPVRLCNYTDVYYNDRITPDMGLMETTATSDEIRRFGLKVGDVVMTKDSEDWTDIAVPALVAKTAPDLVCGYHLGIVRARTPRLYGDYLLRAFQSCAVNQQFQIAASGVTRYGLPKAAIGNAWLPFPTEAEQTAIAGYLDRETGRMDELVGKKQALIERLKEKRTALISRTVTRGLPADLPPETLAQLEAIAGEKLPLNPPLKPSGIDWLGDVPEHWEVKRLGFLVQKVGSGKTPRGGSQSYQHDGVMLIRSQNVYDDGLRLEDVVFIDEKTDEEMAGSRVRPKDVLLNITGASLGRCAVMPSTFPKANVNQHVCIIRPIPQKIDPVFAQLSLTARFVKDQIFAGEEGSSREGLNFQQVRNLTVTAPPLPEQRAIAAYLDEETAKLDALIAKVETAIERLQEYRTALITAAVTGKIDVREEVAV